MHQHTSSSPLQLRSYCSTLFLHHLCTPPSPPPRYLPPVAQGLSVEEYEARKHEAALKLVQRLDAVFPGLASRVDFMEVGHTSVMWPWCGMSVA